MKLMRFCNVFDMNSAIAMTVKCAAVPYCVDTIFRAVFSINSP